METVIRLEWSVWRLNIEPTAVKEGKTVVGVCFYEQSMCLYRLLNLTILSKAKITNMSPAKKTDINATPKKGVQLKFKSNKDVPKTSLSPKKLGNNSSVIIIGSAFGLVFARTTHPTKPGEDAYTYDAKRMLIENPEKAASLNCINVRLLVIIKFMIPSLFSCNLFPSFYL